jgi:hypothetical protein
MLLVNLFLALLSPEVVDGEGSTTASEGLASKLVSWKKLVSLLGS